MGGAATMTSLILGLVVLNLLVILHELGHYLAALRSGLSVPEFAIGFGPRLAAVRIGETTFTWRLLPLGGYVLLPDLAPEDGEPLPSRRARFQALIAGPVANILLALVLLGPARTGAFLVALYHAVTGSVGGVEVVGPVGISLAAQAAAAQGWQTLLHFVGVLSLNLGIFNLLPVPGLDGGRLLGLLAEQLNGGRRPTWEPVLQGTGLLLLLGLGVWVAGKELLQMVF